MTDIAISLAVPIIPYPDKSMALDQFFFYAYVHLSCVDVFDALSISTIGRLRYLLAVRSLVCVLL